MEKFEVHILGCGSALPTTRHFPTSQVVNSRDKLYMIDCGEGAQLQLRKSHLKFTRLAHIFISHLHGDHCFGLPGLISTFGMLGRTAPLHIHAPAELEVLLRPQLDFFCKGIGFEVVFHTIDPGCRQVILEDRSLTVETIPLCHRIPCCGFLFREKPALPHIRRDMIDWLKIPLCEINNIKHGASWTTPDGTLFENHRLVSPAAPPRSYAYCSDTAYLPSLADQLQDVDLLFHEATFAERDAARASETFHSTASQAATLAKVAGAKHLLIGHFSARYEDERTLLAEAQTIFPNTSLAGENRVYRIG